jgi:hypothetical protein
MKNLAGLSSLSFCLGVSIALTACGGGSGSGTSTQPQAQPPVVTSISPAKVTAGAANTTLTVSGSNFTATTVVQVGPTIEPTTFVGTGQLTALLPASQLAEGNTLSVIAVNGSLSSATGAPVSLEVDNPAPAVTLLSPPTAFVGSTPASIAVSGTRLEPGPMASHATISPRTHRRTWSECRDRLPASCPRGLCFVGARTASRYCPSGKISAVASRRLC